MRTTVRLDDALLKTAKQRAAASGKTLAEVIEDALRQALAPRRPVPPPRVELPLLPGKGGLLPGIDVTDFTPG